MQKIRSYTGITVILALLAFAGAGGHRMPDNVMMGDAIIFEMSSRNLAVDKYREYFLLLQRILDSPDAVYALDCLEVLDGIDLCFWTCLGCREPLRKREVFRYNGRDECWRCAGETSAP